MSIEGGGVESTQHILYRAFFNTKFTKLPILLLFNDNQIKAFHVTLSTFLFFNAKTGFHIAIAIN